MASFSVYRREFRDGSVETWSQKETIAWGPCTPPPTLETFSTKITASTPFQYRDRGFTGEEENEGDEEKDGTNS